jgi:hypothetical protein
MLKNWIAAGAFASALGLIVGMPNAQAMPINHIGNGDAQVILVSGGCGPYWHRGPYGGCRPGGQLGYPPGRGPVAFIQGPGGGRFCPPGYHLGQYGGACWPN